MKSQEEINKSIKFAEQALGVKIYDVDFDKPNHESETFQYVYFSMNGFNFMSREYLASIEKKSIKGSIVTKFNAWDLYVFDDQGNDIPTDIQDILSFNEILLRAYLYIIEYVFMQKLQDEDHYQALQESLKYSEIYLKMT